MSALRGKVIGFLLVAFFCLSATQLMYMFRSARGDERIQNNGGIAVIMDQAEARTETPSKIKTRRQDPNVLTKLNITKVGEIFPIDSYPPITLNRGFLIENAGLCSSYLSLTYVVVVHSAPDHFERRQSLRETWAKSGALKGVNSRTIYVLGKSRDKVVQATIEKENEVKKDIVQGDFYDHYRNLTLKAVMGLKWVVKNCPNAEYVIKVDDDVFVNIFQANTFVFPILAANEKQVVCSTEARPWVFRLDTPSKEVDKWKVSNKYFKSLATYPMPFCYGYATFYTTSLAADLLESAFSTPFYRLDDIYVYGILVSKSKGASWRNVGNRYFNDEKRTAELFLKNPNSLVGTVRSRSDMDKLWNGVGKQKR